MKSLKSLLVVFMLGVLVSCSEDDLNKVLNNSGELTDSEIAEGLKEALLVGTDTSTAILSQQNGYFKDAAVKILLPATLQNSIANFRSKSINLGITTVTGEQIYNGTTVLGVTFDGLKSKEDDIILGINRAAEDAASTAAPIFAGAISSITISDANNILFGGVDTAATHFLRNGTYSSLYNQYEPKIENSLQTVKIGSTPVVDEYESFVADYNAILNTQLPGFGTVGSLVNIQTISATDLSAHSTAKGLDGLFLKVADEERDIRKDPLARVSSILEKVFGKLD